MFVVDLGSPSHYSLLGVAPNASTKEIRAARDAIVNGLVQRLRKTTDKKEKERIETRQTKIHRASDELVRPKEREDYDRANAHLAFFLPQVAAASVFVNKADCIYVLRRFITRFLADKGVQLEPLTELERNDFSADETPVALLDRLLQ